MILIPEKCHYMVIGSKDPPRKIMLNKNETISSKENY